MPVLRGHTQRAAALAVERRHVGARLEQRADARRAPLLRCGVQRRRACGCGWLMQGTDSICGRRLMGLLCMLACHVEARCAVLSRVLIKGGWRVAGGGGVLLCSLQIQVRFHAFKALNSSCRRQ
jgi:hypothetical protein